MAKKQKKNLQRLVAKRQQLHQLNQEEALGTAATATASVAAIAAPAIMPALPADTHLIKEVKRTAISFAIISLVLVAAVLIDRQTPFLATFGDRLYTFLRLKG